MEKYNHLILDISLVTSMYLCFRYGNIDKNSLGLLFCNLPIVVAYLKKQPNVGVLLSLIVVLYSYFYLHLSVIFMLIKFSCYYLVWAIGKKRKIRDNTFILLIAVLQGFFFTMEYFYVFTSSNVVSVIRLCFYMLLFYLLPFSLLHLFRLAEQVTSLYLSVSELEKDKQIKNSLFKITHEVKNPIAVCKGYLDMLNVSDKDQVSRYIPIVRQELSRSLDIMNDFMEFSKIKIEKDYIDIHMLLEELESDLNLLIKGKNVSFEMNLSQDEDEVYVMGDYGRLKQVFVNLIKNSLEAMSGRGKILIKAQVFDKYYCIEVIDDGSGMDKETLSHMKEMFFTTKVKGTGLGVSLSNEIIKAHEGTLNYFSELGKGTKVVVKLPITVL
ncbi:MAG: HAMP domain-containing sensor histidine kinase [Bacilli bacterium]|nr:HAMP domain-containing sensor histidine kinase [Bacilli bacterium]